MTVLADSLSRFESRVESGEEGYAPSYKVTGKKGSGKSALVESGVEFARQSGWRVIHIPDASELATSAVHLTAAKEWEGEMYDSADVAGKMLALLAGPWGGDWVASLPLVGTIDGSSVGEGVLEAGGRNKVGDALAWAEKHESLAPAVLAALRAGLSAPQENGSPPVLVAIDGFNALFDKSNFDDGITPTPKEYVAAQQLTHVHMWSHLGQSSTPAPAHNIYGNLLSAPLTNGVVLAADSGSFSQSNAFFDTDAWEAAHMRTRINVPLYSRPELASVLALYAAQGLIAPQTDIVDDMDGIDFDALFGSSDPQGDDAQDAENGALDLDAAPDLDSSFVDVVGALTAGNGAEVARTSLMMLG